MSKLFGYIAICLLAFVAAHHINIPGVTPSQHFDHAKQLDDAGRYILFWNFNKTHVTFEVHVNADGYVGFGISGNGKMYPADLVIGWVNNGTTYFSDRHATDHVMPVKDKQQDWHLLHSEENDFGTVLKFVRKIDTCDTPDDMVIQEGAVRVIYAYSTTDPVSEDHIPYHDKIRGAKSVYLLGDKATPPMPSDIQYFDFFNDNMVTVPIPPQQVLLPAQMTTYNCIGFQMPDIGGKHHMIKFEPIITPGMEAHVHHILIYQCSGIDPNASGVSGHCYDNRPRNLPMCGNNMIVWVVGGEAFYFPPNVGYSIGGPDDASFFIMETHYDNQHLVAGLMDNSGIRISLTKTLRAVEAGLIWFGQNVDFHQVIPPRQANYLSRGYCAEGCLREGMTDVNTTEIKAFAAVQHSHLLGKSMTTHHFRNGVEIKPLIEDPNYDFAYQNLRVFPHEVSIKQGDSIMVDCVYNSMNKSGPTFGGLGTPEEMCVTFVYYYPRMRVSQCLSQVTLDTVQMGRRNEQLYTELLNMDWTNSTVLANFKAAVHNSTVEHYCFGARYKHGVMLHQDYVEHGIQHPYVPPPSTCH